PAVVREMARGPGAARLAEAVEAYEHGRFRDARRLLRNLAERVPGSAAVRELHGLTLYQLGRWREAIRELDAFAQLSDSVDQFPVVADCHRALGHHTVVERLWDELRRSGTSAEVLVEGRIVVAGDRADRDAVLEGIRLLEEGPVHVRSPRPHHLRLWYALAALYEQAGEVPKSRALFRRVFDADPDFADVAARLRGLS
ncbi:MAG: tetratricopeptide repeat protein, partial [Actinomycetota bacterium]|nr:tetratricopeptide repeat protein [Actinomycetota bacterium]